MSDNEVGRSRRIKIVASVTAALGLLGGTLLYAETDASARTFRPAAAVVAPQVVVPQVVTPQAAAAAPVTAAAVITPCATLTACLLQVSNLLGNAQAVGVPGAVSSIVCPALLADRAAVIATFNTINAQFPAFSTTAPEAAALLIIDRLLAFFGCPVPSGVL